MKKLMFTVFLLFLPVVSVFSPVLQAETSKRPNIVFILADDLGWTDTKPYGSSFYPTPNIERLAERGVRFTNAYAGSPICSPTRASIMTGLWPARIGITQPVCHVEEVIVEKRGLVEKEPPRFPYRRAVSLTRLKQEYRTLAESLHDAGYVTGHFGKWHLGREPYDPLHQGFDVDVPHTFLASPPGYLAPWKFPPDLSFKANEPKEHIEDRMANEAVKFIETNQDKPFFLNYWAFSVHGPWQAKEELIEQYQSKVDPSKPHKNPLYAAMIHSLDDAVGRLLDTLDRFNLTDNTIIVFFSDNGGKITHRDPNEPDITSNVPLRAGKGSVYEGGVREPLIIAWANHFKADSVNDELVQSIDFYPTFLDILGLRPEKDQKFDGISFLPALKGEKLNREIYSHFPHGTAGGDNNAGSFVRQGDWKLLRFYSKNDDLTDKYELYNLKDDISESHDLAAEHPDKVVSLKKLLNTFLEETDAVLPEPNPNYRSNPKTH
ncbi:MAG: sulfatase [Planctomycetaceae bacterium]|jgi:arylsulfatase A-like enzyme|nr:sulfatase [Planctomycetaceae bacterium]